MRRRRRMVARPRPATARLAGSGTTGTAALEDEKENEVRALFAVMFQKPGVSSKPVM